MFSLLFIDLSFLYRSIFLSLRRSGVCTCGDAPAWRNGKVVEPLVLHVAGASTEDIQYCGVCVFQPRHQPLVLTVALE